MKNVQNIDKHVLKFLNENKSNNLNSGKFSYNYQINDEKNFERNKDLLNRAFYCYSGMEKIRKNSIRNRKYLFEGQYSDLITIDGRTMTEAEFYKSKGLDPTDVNMILPAVRNFIGQWRKGEYKPIVFAHNREKQTGAEMLNVALISALSQNNMTERNAKMCYEFAISGMPVYKISFAYDYKEKRAVAKFRAVPRGRFFLDNYIEDTIGEDVRFIGEFHDITRDEAILNYSKYVPQSYIDSLFSEHGEYFNNLSSGEFGTAYNRDNLDFLGNNLDIGRIRVYEIWRLEAKWMLEVIDYLSSENYIDVVDISLYDSLIEENRQRSELSQSEGVEVPQLVIRKRFYQYWKCYHIAYNGATLYEAESPYEHLSHPYSYTLYPFIDGVVNGWISHLIPLQRVCNINFMLQRVMLAAGTKDVTIYDIDTLASSGLTLNEVTKQQNKIGATIALDLKGANQMPRKLQQNSGLTLSAANITQQSISLIKEISGIRDSIMGATAQSGKAASLYAQETVNASLNTLDYIESFEEFITRTYMKCAEVIAQFYDKEEYINIIGNDYSEKAKRYTPSEVRDIDFNVTIVKGENVPSLRAMNEQTITQLLQQNIVSLDMFLESSSLPFADKLKQQLQKMRDALSSGKPLGGTPDWLIAEYQRNMQLEGSEAEADGSRDLNTVLANDVENAETPEDVAVNGNISRAENKINVANDILNEQQNKY